MTQITMRREYRTRQNMRPQPRSLLIPKTTQLYHRLPRKIRPSLDHGYLHSGRHHAVGFGDPFHHIRIQTLWPVEVRVKYSKGWQTYTYIYITTKLEQHISTKKEKKIAISLNLSHLLTRFFVETNSYS